MAEWQPIYTAPQDGRRILVCCVEGGEISRIEIAAWSVTKRMKGWRYDWPLGRKLDLPPACWMPLPAPPEVESRSRLRRVSHEKGEGVPRFDGGDDER